MTPPRAFEPAIFVQALQEQRLLCREALAIIEQEHLALHGSGEFNAYRFHQQRKQLLSRLHTSLEGLTKHRALWQAMGPHERAAHAEIPHLIRSNQELIMKAIVLDRENEQALLRRGMLPARHIPPAPRQRPHFVADLYRRHAGP